MTAYSAALWMEALKMRRSLVSVFSALGMLVLPLVAGLFMIILRDPAGARNMGLISAKAQLAAGSADWPSFFGILTQGLAIGGGIVFAIFTAWIFGREFADRTAKEVLAVATPRSAIVFAKFTIVAAWVVALTLLVFIVAVPIGLALALPGWSLTLAVSALGASLAIGAALILLMSWAALFAGIGRGYLLPLAWTVATVVLAQITAVLGWGDWFPWAVPALLSGMTGAPQDLLGPQSIVLVVLTGLLGALAVLIWWRGADHVK